MPISSEEPTAKAWALFFTVTVGLPILYAIWMRENTKNKDRLR